MSLEGTKDELASCRQIFDRMAIESSTNTGLWLERFAKKLGGKDGKRPLLEVVCGKDSPIRVPRHYFEYFHRRKQLLEKDGAFFGSAEVIGRMVVGLGAESVLETSITLHRTYGVPYIPGSALKGLASAAAHRLLACNDWRKAVKEIPQGESHKIMFGDTASAGHVTFHDALFIPARNDERLPLDLDVMTVHHREYYGTGKKAPTDWDSPNPVSFLTAHGKYLIAIEGPKEWALAAWEILKIALAEEGVGAKTAAGYGRMKLEEPEFVVAEQQRTKRNIDRINEIARAFTWKANAKAVLGELLEFIKDEATQDVARETLVSLYDKHKEYWRDWRKNHDKIQWEALEKLGLLPPVPMVPHAKVQVDSTVSEVWEVGSAWLVYDKQRRPSLCICRSSDKKVLDRKLKDVHLSDDALKSELEHATANQPIQVDVMYDGSKIKQIRRAQ